MKHIFIAAIMLCSISAHAAVNISPTGAATYSVPIDVPPGINGMQPNLSLNYNSQGGNGILGVGWSLSGLSAITRCPQTIAQDGTKSGINLDVNDRFCLDGQRLVVTSGTGTYGAVNSEYRTEIESFSRIKASSALAGTGPASFTVETKNGQILEYGVTVDSRIEAQRKTTALKWALNKISDRFGNAVIFIYTEDNAAAYVTGSKVTTPVRMTNIKTYATLKNQEVTVRNYSLAYEYGTEN